MANAGMLVGCGCMAVTYWTNNGLRARNQSFDPETTI